MEMALKKDVYSEYKVIWSGTVCKEVSADCVVPDTMPDVGAVVDAEGTLVLRSRDVNENRVVLEAALNTSVVYASDADGKACSLSLSIPVEISLDAPGVDVDSRSVSRMRVRAVDARMVNSRKVSVRADIEAEVICYGKNILTVASDLEPEQTPAHLLMKTLAVTQVSDVREKTFVITDGYALPAGIGQSDALLSQRVEVFPEDAKFVSGKVVFRGRVRSVLLFGSQNRERIESATCETEFSQIMEVDGDDDVMPEIRLALTGAYFDPLDSAEEQGRMSAEIHMVAQCVCHQKKEVPYIADLYSNCVHLIPAEDTLDVCSQMQPISMRQTVAGKAEPFAGDGEILSMSASVGGITTGESGVKTSVNFRLICRKADGEFFLSRGRLNAEFTLEIPENGELTSIAVKVADVYYSAGSSGIDVRATLQLDALCVHRQQMRCVVSVEEDEEDIREDSGHPSVTLVRIHEDADLWTLAKKYHSTVESIQAANRGKQEGLLLIPKTR